MGRTEELDGMDLDAKKADILKHLATADFLRYDRKLQLEFWAEAIDSLKEEGKVTVEFREVDEQYSYYRVELIDG